MAEEDKKSEEKLEDLQRRSGGTTEWRKRTLSDDESTEEIILKVRSSFSLLYVLSLMVFHIITYQILGKHQALLIFILMSTLGSSSW